MILLFTDWRMALGICLIGCCSCLFELGFSAKIQENLNQKAMDVKSPAQNGCRSVLKRYRDLKANNAEQAYLKGLEKSKMQLLLKHKLPSSMNLVLLLLWFSQIS